MTVWASRSFGNPVPETTARDATVRALQRQLAELMPDDRGDYGPSDGQVLDAFAGQNEPPRLISAAVIEGSAVRAHRVEGTPEPGFDAFLDGTQSSQVVRHANGIPIVRGTVGGVVRVRRDRRMSTWRQRSNTKIYAPLGLIGDRWASVLAALPVPVVDTTLAGGNSVLEHPYAVREAAIHRVQAERERIEEQLATEWCAEAGARLYVDGGISGNERLAGEANVVGVVKSHRTLYAESDALRVILRLGPSERSSVLRVTSPKRTTVASWYLRMHDPIGRDPMWGLVRVEVAYVPEATPSAIAARAEAVSRWILAEVTPVALPDPRWDKMVYGIRDCEEFLRATS